MKTKKLISAMFASMLMMVMCLALTNVNASKEGPKNKGDYCVMKDGKMMCMKGGKMMPMEMDMTMKNGMKCMTNGECIDKDGKKMMLKEGEMMDMNGHVMMHGMKTTTMKKHTRTTTKHTTN